MLAFCQVNVLNEYDDDGNLVVEQKLKNVRKIVVNLDILIVV